MVDFGTPGGGVGFVLVSQGCVTAQTFMEIEENSFSPFFSFFSEWEVEENQEGQWNKEASCIFRETCLSYSVLVLSLSLPSRTEGRECHTETVRSRKPDKTLT